MGEWIQWEDKKMRVSCHLAEMAGWAGPEILALAPLHLILATINQFTKGNNKGRLGDYAFQMLVVSFKFMPWCHCFNNMYLCM